MSENKIFILGKDLNAKHIKGEKKCKQCDEYSFRFDDKRIQEIQFPVEHKGCGGLIHLDRRHYNDEYSLDINLIFVCEKCGNRLDTWTEGELIDEYFKKEFDFIPIDKDRKDWLIW